MPRNKANNPDRPWYEDGLHFTCTQCGACCTGPPGYVGFTDDEAAAIADFLDIDEDDFYRRYTHVVNGVRSLQEVPAARGRGYDCVFLIEREDGTRGCSIYPVRPTQCRTWPFWPENLATEEDWRRAARHCPGMARGLDNPPQGKFFSVEQIRIIRDGHDDA